MKGIQGMVSLKVALELLYRISVDAGGSARYSEESRCWPELRWYRGFILRPFIRTEDFLFSQLY